MQLTAQDLWSLRNILIRAVNESHEVLGAAVRRAPRKAPPSVPAAPPPAPPPKPRLAYPLSEVAILLGVSRASVYRLIALKELKAVRIGSRRLIEAAEIEGMLSRARRRG
jgi:excisionase family DNA binding protein